MQKGILNQYTSTYGHALACTNPVRHKYSVTVTVTVRLYCNSYLVCHYTFDTHNCMCVCVCLIRRKYTCVYMLMNMHILRWPKDNWLQYPAGKKFPKFESMP